MTESKYREHWPDWVEDDGQYTAVCRCGFRTTGSDRHAVEDELFVHLPGTLAHDAARLHAAAGELWAAIRDAPGVDRCARAVEAVLLWLGRRLP